MADGTAEHTLPAPPELAVGAGEAARGQRLRLVVAFQLAHAAAVVVSRAAGSGGWQPPATEQRALAAALRAAVDELRQTLVGGSAFTAPAEDQSTLKLREWALHAHLCTCRYLQACERMLEPALPSAGSPPPPAPAIVTSGSPADGGGAASLPGELADLDAFVDRALSPRPSAGLTVTVDDKNRVSQRHLWCAVLLALTGCTRGASSTLPDPHSFVRRTVVVLLESCAAGGSSSSSSDPPELLQLMQTVVLALHQYRSGLLDDVELKAVSTLLRAAAGVGANADDILHTAWHRLLHQWRALLYRPVHKLLGSSVRQQVLEVLLQAAACSGMEAGWHPQNMPGIGPTGSPGLPPNYAAPVSTGSSIAGIAAGADAELDALERDKASQAATPAPAPTTSKLSSTAKAFVPSAAAAPFSPASTPAATTTATAAAGAAASASASAAGPSASRPAPHMPMSMAGPHGGPYGPGPAYSMGGVSMAMNNPGMGGMPMHGRMPAGPPHMMHMSQHAFFPPRSANPYARPPPHVGIAPGYPPMAGVSGAAITGAYGMPLPHHPYAPPPPQQQHPPPPPHQQQPPPPHMIPGPHTSVITGGHPYPGVPMPAGPGGPRPPGSPMMVMMPRPPPQASSPLPQSASPLPPPAVGRSPYDPPLSGSSPAPLGVQPAASPGPPLLTAAQPAQPPNVPTAQPATSAQALSPSPPPGMEPSPPATPDGPSSDALQEGQPAARPEEQAASPGGQQPAPQPASEAPAATAPPPVAAPPAEEPTPETAPLPPDSPLTDSPPATPQEAAAPAPDAGNTTPSGSRTSVISTTTERMTSRTPTPPPIHDSLDVDHTRTQTNSPVTPRAREDNRPIAPLDGSTATASALAPVIEDDGAAADGKADTKPKPVLPLSTPWSVWYIPPDFWKTNINPSDEAYSAALKKIASFDTVQSFWETVEKLPQPPLSPNENYFMMRYDWRPLWETRQVSSGGCFKLRCSKSDSPVLFANLLLAVVGDAFASVCAPSDDICGLTWSFKRYEDEYVLWNIDSQHGQESVQKIVQLLRTLAPSVILNKVFYKTYQKRGF